MSFDLSEKHLAFLEQVRSFAREEILPLGDSMRQHDAPFPRELFCRMGKAGLLTLCVSPEQGGTRLDTVAYSMAMREISRVESGVSVAMSVTNMVAESICRMGRPDQIARYIPPLARGESPAAAFALTEANAGSDPAAVATRAVRDGDDYVIDGEKTFITSGDAADVILLMARTDPTPGHKGISAFLVERGTPGLTVGKREHKMGMESSSTVTLAFSQCRIPASAMLGEPGQGFRAAMASLDSGRIGIASQALGIADAAFAAVLQAVKEQPALQQRQDVQFRLADMKVKLDSSELLIRRAALLKDAGRPFTLEASLAKYHSTESAVEICSDAVSLLGLDGLTDRYPVERCLRDARITTIYEGTSQIQKIVIAKQLLK